MFGIGMPEMILILALALIVIGPKKLPDLAKSMGRAFREFKKATNEIKDSMGIDDELQEVKNSFNEINTNIKESIDPTAPSAKAEEKDQSAPAEGVGTHNDEPLPEKPEGELDRLSSAFTEMNEEQKALFSEDHPAGTEAAKPAELTDPEAKKEKDS